CRSQRLVEGNELGSDRPLMLLQQPGSRLAAEGLDVVEPGPSAVELGELEDVPAVEPQTSRTRVLSGQRRSRPRMLPARLVLERRGVPGHRLAGKTSTTIGDDPAPKALRAPDPLTQALELYDLAMIDE